MNRAEPVARVSTVPSAAPHRLDALTGDVEMRGTVERDGDTVRRRDRRYRDRGPFSFSSTTRRRRWESGCWERTISSRGGGGGGGDDCRKASNESSVAVGGEGLSWRFFRRGFLRGVLRGRRLENHVMRGRGLRLLNVTLAAMRLLRVGRRRRSGRRIETLDAPLTDRVRRRRTVRRWTHRTHQRHARDVVERLLRFLWRFLWRFLLRILRGRRDRFLRRQRRRRQRGRRREGRI